MDRDSSAIDVKEIVQEMVVSYADGVNGAVTGIHVNSGGLLNGSIYVWSTAVSKVHTSSPDSESVR